MDLPWKYASPKLIDSKLMEEGRVAVRRKSTIFEEGWEGDLFFLFGVALVEYFLEVEVEAVLILEQLIAELV